MSLVTETKAKRRGRKAQDPEQQFQQALQSGRIQDRSQISPDTIRRKLSAKSEAQYEREWTYWMAYQRMYPNSDLCDLQTHKHFVQFVASSMKGRILENKAPTPNSVYGRMRRFWGTWERHNKTTIGSFVQETITAYIFGELLDLISSKHVKKKPDFLTVANFVHMQQFYWENDHHDEVHEGVRADNCQLLNIHANTSARLSEVSQARFKDIQCLLGWRDGSPEFSIKFTRAICKGNDPQKPEHTFAEIVQGADGSPLALPLFGQQMLHWLAIFIAAGAFVGLNTVDDVLRAMQPKNTEFRVMEWSDPDKPVFPRWTRNGPTSEPRSPKSWGNQASNWALRAGFTTGLGLHAPRREAIIKVNDAGYSTGELIKFASQRSLDVAIRHYLGSISGIDSEAARYGAKPRPEVAERFRSATMRRNPDLRFSLPSKLLDQLQDRDEYISIIKKIESINQQLENSISHDIIDVLKEKRRALYREKRVISDQALKDYQKSQPLVYDIAQEEYQQDDCRQTHFNRIRHMLPKERVRLSETLLLRELPRSTMWISALRDLVAIRTQDYRVAYQDILRPVNGKCPNCRIDMETLKAERRWWHVYTCSRNSKAKTSGFAEFCFICSEWVTEQLSWVAHCASHIAEETIPFRCNPVTYRHGVACAGYCPVHLGRSDLPPNERMIQFPDQSAWKRHVSRCVPLYLQSLKYTSEVKCPHLRCPTVWNTLDDMWHHLRDIHSMTREDSKTRTWTSRDDEVSDQPKLKLRKTFEFQANTPLCVPEKQDTAILSPGNTIHDSLDNLSPQKFRSMNSGLGFCELNSEGLEYPIDPELEAASLPLKPNIYVSNSLGQSIPIDEEGYPVEKLLGKWKGQFFLKWQDGSYGWEPRKNIHADMIRSFEKEYKGFEDGIKVLCTRVRGGKSEYRLHWIGRPNSEDWWVAEKEMSPVMIEKHRPERKGKKGKKGHKKT